MAIDNASILLQSDVNPAVNLLGIYLPIVTAIAAGAGGFVSIITYVFERRKFRLKALTEAFRLLNDVKHREARKVVYGNATVSSFEIFGLVGLNSKEKVSCDELNRICRDIVRSDFNEIGTLIRYNLLDGKIFIEEYYWMILKIWDLLKDEIERRRNGIGPPNYMQNLEDLYKQALEYTEKHHPDVYRSFHNNNATTETPKKGAPF
jgi:hypothetical protein